MGWHKINRDLRVTGAIRSSTTITVDSGGIVNTAGSLTMTAGGVDLPVSSGGTTGTNLPNYGLSIIGDASTAQTFTLAAPAQGVDKYIEITGGSSSVAHVLRTSTGGAVTFNGTDHIMTVTTAGDGNIGLHLMGATTARWVIVGSYGTLTYSTS
jgi:hypothetical protein